VPSRAHCVRPSRGVRAENTAPTRHHGWAGEGQFPFESASASGDTMAGRRQVENAAAGGVGAGSWGPSDGPYAYGDGGFAFEGSASGKGTGRGAPGGRETDMHSAGRRSEGGGMREPRRLPERDMYGQTSLERLEEENSSLRAITKYLIHERKELRKKADMASKRNQNLNNLLQVMKWSLQQGGAGACGASACGAVASSSRAMPRMAASNSSSWHSMTLVPEGDLVRCPPPPSLRPPHNPSPCPPAGCPTLSCFTRWHVSRMPSASGGHCS